MIGGHVVLGRMDGQNARIEQYKMTQNSLQGLGDAIPGGLSDASFTQADGKSVLKFTAGSIAGQAIKIGSRDDLIAAHRSDNKLAMHTGKGTFLTMSSWAGAGPTPKQNPLSKEWFCDVKGTASDPTDCSSGTKFMGAYSTQQSCLRAAGRAYADDRDTLYKEVSDSDNSFRKDQGLRACRAASDCEKEWIKYYDSKKGMIEECENFFSGIKTSYPWSTKCQQKQICEVYSGAGTTNAPAAQRTYKMKLASPKNGTDIQAPSFKSALQTGLADLLKVSADTIEIVKTAITTARRRGGVLEVEFQTDAADVMTKLEGKSVKVGGETLLISSVADVPVTSAPIEGSSKKGLGGGAIAGIIIACIVLLGLIVFGVVTMKKRSTHTSGDLGQVDL